MDLKKYIYNNRWTIGFSEDSLEDIVSGKQPFIHWMKNPYKNRWFADPFILDVTKDDISVLVEEFFDPIQRGRISKLTIDRRRCQLKNISVVLELPTHLSFPVIKRIGDDIYIYPENGASNELVLYKYNPITDECKRERVLVKGYLADAIETDVFGEKLLFTTIVPNHNGKNLLVYKELNGTYSKVNEVHFESNIARNAGDWFVVDEKIYRPCQDCNERYGGAIILQEVSREGETYIFREVNRFDYTYKSYQLGCHTFNHYKGVSVFDVNGYRRPFMAKSVGAIMRVVRMILK